MPLSDSFLYPRAYTSAVLVMCLSKPIRRIPDLFYPLKTMHHSDAFSDASARTRPRPSTRCRAAAALQRVQAAGVAMNGEATQLTATGPLPPMVTAASTARRMHHVHRQGQRPNHLVGITISFGALALGALLYAVVRPHAAMFLPSGWHQPLLDSPWSPLMRVVLGSAPTFLHATAMSLLICAAVQAATRGGIGRCCAAVWGVEFVFEFAQHASIAAVLLSFSSSAPAANGLVTALRAYVARGTFDPLDLLAAFAGCIAAFTVLAGPAHRTLTSPGARHVAA